MTAEGGIPGLLDVLDARTGVVCAVGAGGKKSTLYRLASMHPGKVALTCTVPNTHYPSELAARVVIAPPEDLVPSVAEAAAGHRLVAFAQPSDKPDRYGGVPPALISEIREAGIFDVILVKADGARMRWIKAPAGGEPVLPTAMTTLLPLVSARALGERLDGRVAHRLDRVLALTGASEGEVVSEGHMARVLSSDDGALKGCGDARVVPIINMVDDEERRKPASAAAREALALTDRFTRVVLTCMIRDDPLVDVIRP